MPEIQPTPGDPSLRDAVTELPNRRALLAELRERVRSGSGAIVLLDLDQWKRVQERLQRPQIETILKEIADRLRTAAGAGALLYRYAGDAFCLVLPEADRERAAAAAETLRASIGDRPFKFGEAKGVTMVAARLTASASAAAYPIDGRTPTTLIETAELGIMVAKHSGRNRVTVAGRLDAAALAEIGVYRGLPCPVLVGRVAEQSRLRQLASDVRHVGPTVALVSSPPGLGKTRLLRELGLWARSEKFVAMGGTCRESRAALPYAVLSELIENLLVTDRATASQAIRGLSAEHRAALAVVIRDFPAEDAAAVDLTQYGRLILEAFGALLGELARIGPLFLAMDEIEFADAATFEVFERALKLHLPFFLVTASHEPEVELAKTPAGAFFKARGPALATVSLAHLTSEEMEKMLRAILPEAEIPEVALQSLIFAAKGNPLYAEETLRSLLLRGKVRLDQGKWAVPALEKAELPADLDAAVRSVAEALPARANSLLARAAVIGPEVDPELLQEVMGQDEMEMLDLIDEARRSRLLGTGETDLLTFPAAHARKVRLESSEPDERRQIHARVGVVQEARHGGDVAHIADDLAWHYGQAGDRARAQHFDTVARRRAVLIEPPRPQGLKRARLDPVKDLLTPQATEHAVSLMRFFAASLRIGRLYPEKSQVSGTFVQQLRTAIESLFGCGTGVTISRSAEGTLLNGAKCEAAGVNEFSAILEERLIESMTLLRNFDPGRMQDILQAFIAPFDASLAPTDHWDRFLEKKQIEGFDVVQKSYQARDRGAKGAIVRGEEPLKLSEMFPLREALRALKAAVENVRLYPPGHQLVEETADEATRMLQEFLSKVPAVTLGTSEGDLVLNGAASERKLFGDVGTFFVKEIDQRALWSISIGRGLKGDEVRSLIGLLGLPKEGDKGAADRLIAQMSHVVFGSRQYERATEGQEVELKPPPKPIRSEIRAREYLALSYDQFLSPQLEEAFPLLVEALAYGTRKPLAEQLVDRLGEHFHDLSLRHRRMALDLLARALAFASPSCRQVQIARSTPPLHKRLVEDLVPKAFRAAADILPIWIPAAATTGCLRELAEITGQVLRKRADAAETPGEIRAAAEGALQLIPGTGAYPVILAAVRRTRQDDRMLALGILISIGSVAVQKLVELLVDEPDLAARQSASLALGLVAPQITPELIRALGPDVPVERFTRLFEVLQPLLTADLATHLGEMAATGKPDVQKVILSAVDTLPRPVGVAVTKRLIAEREKSRRDYGIEMARRLKVEQVCAELGKMLEREEEENALRLLSRYFAEVPNPAVVPALVRVAASRPKFFGLRKGYSAETRAEAVKALAVAGTKEALETVDQMRGDTDLRELLKDLPVPEAKTQEPEA